MRHAEVQQLLVAVVVVCFLIQDGTAARGRPRNPTPKRPGFPVVPGLPGLPDNIISFGLPTPTGSMDIYYPGNISFFNVDAQGNTGPLGSVPIPTGTQPGYCLDRRRYIQNGHYQCVTYCSSLDPDFFQCIAKVAGSTYQSPQYSLDLDKVNWIINNYFDGQVDGESNCSAGNFTKDDIQDAIWLVANPAYTSKLCRANFIRRQADISGVGFVPDKCYQLAAVAVLVYDCGTSFKPPHPMKQLLFFYNQLDTLGASCVPWPKCTQPQLPPECIGNTYEEINSLVQYTGTELHVEPGQRRNLTCAECEIKTGTTPDGCGCPDWPCCGVNLDTPGFTCPPCPAVSKSSAYARAGSGPGGCSFAASWASGESVNEAVMKINMYDVVKQIITNNTVAGPNITAKATAIANAFGTATAKAALQYYQTGCVCKKAPGFAISRVTANIYAVATAVAEAYASALASIYDNKYMAYVAYSSASTPALAASVNSAVVKFIEEKTYAPGQCDLKTSVIESVMATNISNAVACTIAESVAFAYYFPTTDPFNPYPLGLTDGCACSVSVSVGGNLNLTSVCPISCPTDPQNPGQGSCVCANGYQPSNLGCAGTNP